MAIQLGSPDQGGESGFGQIASIYAQAAARRQQHAAPPLIQGPTTYMAGGAPGGGAPLGDRDVFIANAAQEQQQQRAQLQSWLMNQDMTQHETLRLQQQKNALGAIQADPDLSDEEKQQYTTQLQVPINIGQQRLQAMQLRGMQAQQQQAMHVAALNDSVQNVQMDNAAQNAPNRFLLANPGMPQSDTNPIVGVWVPGAHGPVLHNISAKRAATGGAREQTPDQIDKPWHDSYRHHLDQVQKEHGASALGEDRYSLERQMETVHRRMAEEGFAPTIEQHRQQAALRTPEGRRRAAEDTERRTTDVELQRRANQIDAMTQAPQQLRDELHADVARTRRLIADKGTVAKMTPAERNEFAQIAYRLRRGISGPPPAPPPQPAAAPAPTQRPAPRPLVGYGGAGAMSLQQAMGE